VEYFIGTTSSDQTFSFKGITLYVDKSETSKPRLRYDNASGDFIEEACKLYTLGHGNVSWVQSWKQENRYGAHAFHTFANLMATNRKTIWILTAMLALPATFARYKG